MSGRRFQTRFNALINRILDPALCLGCAHALEAGQRFCENCLIELKCVNSPCTLCGLENQTKDSLCAACLYDPPRWQKLVAPLMYEGLSRDLLLQLKYAERLHPANSLVNHLIDFYRNISPAPEVLLPVPLHQRRLLDRGYNQAFEIARILSQLLDIPVDTRALRRIRDTTSPIFTSPWLTTSSRLVRQPTKLPKQYTGQVAHRSKSGVWRGYRCYRSKTD